MIERLKVAFAMREAVLPRIFPADRRAGIEQIADVAGVLTEFDSPAALAVLAETDVLITGWGAPVVDLDVVRAAPRLRAVLHSAGTVKPYIGDGVLERGIKVSSAAAANAVPVAEYTVAMIVLAGKKVLPIAARYRESRTSFAADAVFPEMGNYDVRVGIVGASKIGRLVIGMLRSYDMEVVVYDPYLSVEDAASLGVVAVELDELLATSDVVSVHAPSLPSTLDLIDRRGIGLMRHGTTLVNTARGEIVDQVALTERVIAGEIYAILDVTVPWVLEQEHPLYSSENALLTPHIAGSQGNELGRLADSVLRELLRLSEDLPLEHGIDAAALAITA